MSNRLRWGILGTGNIARQFAAGFITSTRGDIVAVGSRQGETAAIFAQSHNVPAAYASYDEVLTDRKVEAVYNALPNSLHHEWTIKALHSGKHVLCEKPLAANLAQSQEMFDAAERTGKILVEAFMYRSHPLTHAVAEVVRSGAIGRLHLIRTSFCYRTNRIEDNVRFSTHLAGGSLMDIGCYCINFSRFFAGGEPREVHAVAHRHETGVDDVVAGTLIFPGGIVAGFTCGMSVQADNTAYLCGSDGFIEIPIPWKPPMKQAAFTIARGTPPRMDIGSGQPVPVPPRQTRYVDAEKDLYALEADEFAVTVLDGMPPRITRQDTLGNMAILDQLRRQIGLSV